jgi:hypothetical protein
MKTSDLAYLIIGLLLFLIVMICPIRNSTLVSVVDRFDIAGQSFDFIKRRTFAIPVFLSPTVLNVRAGIMSIDPSTNKINYIDSSGNPYTINLTDVGSSLPFLMMRFV